MEDRLRAHLVRARNCLVTGVLKVVTALFRVVTPFVALVRGGCRGGEALCGCLQSP